MTNHSTAVGFFGKLPCKGDFLQRRVSQDFVQVWDSWLQLCMSDSRTQLQDRWLEAYLTSPVWRFVLSEGICGSGAYAGVMVPSVDRVGRYFPLTIVAQWNVEDCPLDVACSAQRWFYSAEALALTVPETTDFDAFDAQVERLAGLIDPSGVAESSYLRGLIQRSEFPHRAAHWHVPLASVHSLQRAVNALAFRELERTLRPLSVWWTDGSDSVDPAWLCLRGLPESKTFGAMLAGEWPDSGWTSLDAKAARAQRKPPPPPSPYAAPPPSDSYQGGLIPSMSFELERADPYALRHTTIPDLIRPEPTRPLLDPPRPPLYPLSEPQAAPAVDIQMAAAHEPLARKWGAESSGAFFVVRPELGLWGVAYSDEKHTDYSAAQSIADVLQSVPPGGTLTTLVEEVRRALDAVRRQLARASMVSSTRAPVHSRAIVFLTRGEECALIYWGDVQAVRCRASEVASIIGVPEFDDLSLETTIARELPEGAGSLLDLVDPSIERPQVQVAEDREEVQVRYESLQVGDAWMLAGAPLFDEPQVPTLAPAFSQGPSNLTQALAAVRAACHEEARQMRPLPVLMLAASYWEGEA